MRNLFNKSRTEYSLQNTSVAIASRIISLLVGYIARIVFTHALSTDYVGLNGLFFDIFQVLSLSELGVGTAITYALYGPIARNDLEKQKTLMCLYRKFYHVTAGLILVLGVSIMPFIPYIVSVDINLNEIYTIYVLFLVNTCLSYVLVYRKTLIDAHQLNYITVLIKTIIWTLQNILQIIVLLITHNFILYLSIAICATLVINVICSIVAVKLFPYLKDKNIQPLNADDRKNIYLNIRTMMVHKLGTVLVNNTDNILISIIIGTLAVGSYSNYYLIVASALQLFNQLFEGITASVGNLGETESNEKIKKIFEISFFIGQWIYGLLAICLFQVLDMFVQMSFGEQYVFDRSVTLVICLVLYLKGMREPCLIFRDSMGLFRYDWMKAIAEVIINIGVSILLGKLYGVIGIFLGTVICTLSTSTWVEPYILYKYRLKSDVKIYFIKWIMYALVMCIAFWLSTFSSTLLIEKIFCVNLGNLFIGKSNAFYEASVGIKIAVMLIRGAISFTITNILFVIAYNRTEEFKFIFSKVKKIIVK